MPKYYYKAGKTWEDVKLWEATQNNPQEDINVESVLNQDNYWNIGSFLELAKEMQIVSKRYENVSFCKNSSDFLCVLIFYA